MKRLILLSILSVCILSSAIAQSRSDPALKVIATGSGFLVTSQGHIVTNNHVVEGCALLNVRANGVEQPVKVIAQDKENDLALVQIGTSTQRPLTFRTGQRIKLGESVAAAGFPIPWLTASSINLTTGTISALAGLGDDTRMIQSTAPIQPGNSGGPLLDQAGNVIGVVTSKLSARAANAIGDIPQNVNFAIRDSVVKAFLESRGVEYVVNQPTAALQTTEIAERAERGTVFVQCLANEASSPISERPTNISKRPTNRRTSAEVLADAKSLQVQIVAGSPVLKTEISKELLKWGKLTLVSQSDGADLMLSIAQTGRLDMMGSGNQAAAILRDPEGTELWSTTKGGSWAMSGWSNAWVGRAIAKDLIKFIEQVDRNRRK
jgi:hypothetical protein